MEVASGICQRRYWSSGCWHWPIPSPWAPRYQGNRAGQIACPIDFPGWRRPPAVHQMGESWPSRPGGIKGGRQVRPCSWTSTLSNASPSTVTFQVIQTLKISNLSSHLPVTASSKPEVGSKPSVPDAVVHLTIPSAMRRGPRDSSNT